ncbi:MAG: BlaI/MecI/CopY family transcriptional regulator [Microgenomates group bacterium]
MPNSPSLGQLEQAIMEIIWQKPATVHAIQQSLISKYKEVAYTTVLTVLSRLQTKGLVSRLKEGRHHVYEPVNNKDSFVRNMVRQTIDQFVSKYGQDAVVAFAHETAKLKVHSDKKSKATSK